jgi:hypothetical protein
MYPKCFDVKPSQLMLFGLPAANLGAEILRKMAETEGGAPPAKP